MRKYGFISTVIYAESPEPYILILILLYILYVLWIFCSIRVYIFYSLTSLTVALFFQSKAMGKIDILSPCLVLFMDFK